MKLLSRARRAAPEPQGAALAERLDLVFHVVVMVNDELVIRAVRAESALAARKQYLRTMGRREAIVRIDGPVLA